MIKSTRCGLCLRHRLRWRTTSELGAGLDRFNSLYYLISTIQDPSTLTTTAHHVHRRPQPRPDCEDAEPQSDASAED